MRTAILLAVCLFIMGAGPEAQKPVVRLPLKGDSFIAGLNTVEDLATAADAVIVGQVVGVRNASADGRPRTSYTVRVLEVLKGHRPTPAEVTVLRGTGVVEYPDRTVVYEDPELPEFTSGARYLLFLRWNGPTAGYWIVQASVGAAAIDSESHLKTVGRHPVSRMLKGMSLAEVRQIVRGR
jgi:hypothetical protein